MFKLKIKLIKCNNCKGTGFDITGLTCEICNGLGFGTEPNHSELIKFFISKAKIQDKIEEEMTCKTLILRKLEEMIL